MKHRPPPLYEARIWDIKGGQPVATETIRRRTLASARAAAVSRMALPVPICAELVEIESGRIIEVSYNHAGRALALPAQPEENPAP